MTRAIVLTGRLLLISNISSMLWVITNKLIGPITAVQCCMTARPARGEYVRCLHEILIPCPFSFHSLTPISCWLPCNFNFGVCRQLTAENLMNTAKYRTMRRPKTKRLLASGGLYPRPPDQGLCPWTPLGAPPPDLRYRLALPRSPYLCAPLKFILAPLGLKFWRRRCHILSACPIVETPCIISF